MRSRTTRLNQTIDRLREMYAQLEVVEGRPLDKTDTAIIDFEGFQDGKSIEGAKAADHMLALGTNSPDPGLRGAAGGHEQGRDAEDQGHLPDGLQQ